MLVSRSQAAAPLAALLALGGVMSCHDAPLSPAVAPALVAGARAAGSDTTQAPFVSPPFTFRRPLAVSDSAVTGVFDPTRTPVVQVCVLASDSTCASAPIAQFTTGERGSDVVRVVEGFSGRGGSGGPGYYVVRWHTRSTTLQDSTVYGIRVLLSGHLLGVALVRPLKWSGSTDDDRSDNPGNPANDPWNARDGFSRDSNGVLQFRDGRTLPIRFWIGKPPQTLFSIAGPSVTGTPVSGSVALPYGTRVHYTYAAAQGFTTPEVLLDAELAPSSGTIVMDTAHVLFASAAIIVRTDSVDQTILAGARGLLTASNPVAAFQAQLNLISQRTQGMSLDQMTNVLNQTYTQAYDPFADAPALGRLDLALAGHTFTIASPSTSSASSALTRAKTRLARSTTRDDAAPGDTLEPTTFLYTNGIFTPASASQHTANLIEGLLISATAMNDGPFTVIYRYNPTLTNQIMSDTAHIGAQCLEETAQYEAQGHSTSDALAHMATCVGFKGSVAAFVQNFDLAECLRQYLNLVSTVPSSGSEEPFAVDLANAIDSLRQTGVHAIVIPHSQGNMMFQQAVNVMIARGTYQAYTGALLPRGDSLCVGGVDLAAPVDVNWPLPPEQLQFVQITDDMVADLIFAPVHNTHPRTDTPLSNQYAAQVAADKATIGSALATSPAGLLTQALAMIDYTYLAGVQIHSIDNDYLNYSSSRQVIAAAMQSVYNGCAVGSVVILPTDFTGENVGSTYQLQAVVSDQNGVRMDSAAIVHWSSSDPTIATVDSTGLVTGVRAGSVTLTARARLRSATLPITIVQGSSSSNPVPSGEFSVAGTWVDYFSDTLRLQEEFGCDVEDYGPDFSCIQGTLFITKDVTTADSTDTLRGAFLQDGGGAAPGTPGFYRLGAADIEVNTYEIVATPDTLVLRCPASYDGTCLSYTFTTHTGSVTVATVSADAVRRAKTLRRASAGILLDRARSLSDIMGRRP